MEREKVLAKNTFILSLGTVFPKVVHFFALPILTACLTQSEYGYYDLIITAVSLFLPLATLQIETAAFRYLIDCREEVNEKKRVITNIVVFVLIVSVLALILLFFAMYKLPMIFRVSICCYYFVDMILNMTRKIIRGLGENKIYANSILVESIFYIVYIILFVAFFKWGLIGVLLALILALILAESYIIYKKNIICLIDINQMNRSVIRELLHYSLPMIPNSFSHWVMRLSDRWVISTFLGIEMNAIYAVATKIPTLYGTLQNTFTLAWQENASIVKKDNDAEAYYSKMFDVMYCIYFAIMSMLIAATPVLFTLLIHGDYKEAYFQIPILYIASFFSSLAAYLGGVYVAYKRTKAVGTTTILAAGCNLVVDLMLVKSVGIYAGSISTLVSYIILFLYRMKDIQKIQKIEFNVAKMLKMLIILLLMSLFVCQKNIVFDILNVLIAIIASLFYNKQVIKSVLSAIKKEK